MPGGRITSRKVTKKELLKAVREMGGVCNLARAIKESPSCISNWLYTDIRIRLSIASKIEKCCRNVKSDKLISENAKRINKCSQ